MTEATITRWIAPCKSSRPSKDLTKDQNSSLWSLDLQISLKYSKKIEYFLLGPQIVNSEHLRILFDSPDFSLEMASSEHQQNSLATSHDDLLEQLPLESLSLNPLNQSVDTIVFANISTIESSPLKSQSAPEIQIPSEENGSSTGLSELQNGGTVNELPISIPEGVPSALSEETPSSVEDRSIVPASMLAFKSVSWAEIVSQSTTSQLPISNDEENYLSEDDSGSEEADDSESDDSDDDNSENENYGEIPPRDLSEHDPMEFFSDFCSISNREKVLNLVKDVTAS